MKLIPYLLVLGLWIASADTSKAQTEIPALQQRVTDFTNTLSYSDWKDLESRLKRFEDSTSTQIAILMINSLEGASIEEYSMRVFEKNKLGQKGKDNGVLILVAKTDRKVRIDVGYGLEGVLTDALNSQIVTRQILPEFKAGNFYGGLVAGVEAIMAASAGEYEADGVGGIAPATTVVLLIVLFGVIRMIIIPLLSSKRRTLITSGTWTYHSGWGWGSGSSMGRRYGGGSFGGGGFSGGGFSGGGGMAGGGGASGSW
jgi:uncharacterized protein